MKKYSILFVFFFLVSHFAFGQIPQEISYQGVLTETDGTPVGDGNYSMTFALYNTAMGGAPIWQEAKVVLVLNGVFNVILGDVTPLSPDFTDAYWLGVKVGAAAEMTPRVKLTASAYSLNAEKVNGFEVSPTPSPNTILPLNASGKYPASVLPTPQMTNMGGNYGTTNVTIDGSAFIEILSFTVNQAGSFNVTLNANLVGEINGDGTGRYEFKITRGSVNGTQVARGWWRPGTSGGQQAVTIPLSGVDNNVSGPTTYYLVGRKYDSGAKDLLVFIYNLHAIWVTN
ncbi:MAG: hypothetical protein IPL49_16540 [Saprospirales bacterium]|nr:hypothetical protein [Saprospirales bacterium]